MKKKPTKKKPTKPTKKKPTKPTKKKPTNTNTNATIEEQALASKIAPLAKKGDQDKLTEVYAVGALLYKEAYNSDAGRVQRRQPIPEMSIENLSVILQGSGVHRSPTTLYDYMKVAIEPAKIRNRAAYKKLEYGHRLELTKITDLKIKADLADRCAANNWIFGKLYQEVYREIHGYYPKSRQRNLRLTTDFSDYDPTDTKKAHTYLPPGFTKQQLGYVIQHLTDVYNSTP